MTCRVFLLPVAAMPPKVVTASTCVSGRPLRCSICTRLGMEPRSADMEAAEDEPAAAAVPALGAGWYSRRNAERRRARGLASLGWALRHPNPLSQPPLVRQGLDLE